MEQHYYLIVDDDQAFRERLCSAIESRGHKAVGAESFDTAMSVVQKFKPQRVVLDLKMPGKSGLDLIPELIRIVPEVQIVVLTGYGSIPSALQAVKNGAINFLTKPLDTDSIIVGFSSAESPQVYDGDPKIPSLALAEWEYINRVLNDCEGNISRTAKILQVHRRTLQRKLHKMPNG